MIGNSSLKKNLNRKIQVWSALQEGHFMFVPQIPLRLFAVHNKDRGGLKKTDDVIPIFNLVQDLGHVYTFLASPIYLPCLSVV